MNQFIVPGQDLRWHDGRNSKKQPIQHPWLASFGEADVSSANDLDGRAFFQGMCRDGRRRPY